MHAVARAIGLIRAPILICLGVAAILLLAGQSGEVVQAIWHARGAELISGGVRAMIGCGVLAVAVLGCCLFLLANAPQERRADIASKLPIVGRLALVLPLTPFISLALASIRVGASSLVPQPDQFVWSRTASFLGFVLALVFFFICLLPFTGLAARVAAPGGRFALDLASRRAIVPLLGLLSAIGVIITLSAISPYQVAQLLGPVLLLMLFCSFLCIFASLLTHLYDRYQVPALSILAGFAVVCASFGLNDNRAVRMLSVAAPVPVAPRVNDAFVDWLANRADLADYAGRPYPVYVVAAEGGGLYAAAHAAFTLARLADSCPAFPRHVFAISAVSGGGVGASVFSALLQSVPPGDKTVKAADCAAGERNDGPLLRGARQFMAEDFLTPLLVAGLFPDFLQQFLPRPVPPFGRARALEQTYELAWEKIVRSSGRGDPDLFRRDYRSVWSPAGDYPAVLLNVTRTWTGGRVVMSPFVLGPNYPFSDDATDLLNTGASFRLSTAVGMSARYPIITPPATVDTSNRDRAPAERRPQLVDGGYFDNTGMQTAADLIKTIRQAGVAEAGGLPTASSIAGCAPGNAARVRLASGEIKSVCFKIIVLRAASQFVRYKELDEISAVLKTAYRARGSMSRHIRRGVLEDFCGGKGCGRGPFARWPHVLVKYLAVDQLPLGWYLSARSLDGIENGPNRFRACPDGEPEPAAVEPMAMNEHENICLYHRLRLDLLGRAE